MSEVVSRKKKTEEDIEKDLEENPIEKSINLNIKSDDNKMFNANSVIPVLRRFNKILFITSLVLFLFALCLSNKKKRERYYAKKMRQLEEISKIIEDQNQALSNRYHSLSNSLASLLSSSSSAVASSATSMEELDEVIKNQEEIIKAKDSTLDALQLEIKKMREELAQVKNSMDTSKSEIANFCGECKFQGLGGIYSDCNDRMRDLVTRKQHTEDIAMLAVMSTSPSCFRKTSESSKFELDVSNFCAECEYRDAKGLVVPKCRGRKYFILKTHELPEDVAKIVTMRASPSCIIK